MSNENNYFDIQHIKNFMEGDEASFNIIYEFYKKRIFYMGMQLFHNDEERSKDLVQNTFTQVYINIKKLKAPEAFYVWMSRIAYLQGCGMLRYHSKDTSYYIKDDGEFLDYTTKEVITDGITELQRKEAIELILSELNIMDENKRLIGYLRYFEELSIKEISEITEIKENTVMSHLHRIKMQLKNKLESLGFTKSTCLGLLVVPNLISYYKAFVETQNPTTLPVSEPIVAQAKHEKVQKKSMHWVNISKIAVGLGVGISILSVAGAEMQNHNITTESPVISSVEYEKKIVNKPIKLQVKTSNDNYDAILLNDSSELKVYQNGVYTLNLMKDGKILSTQDVKITNIDMNIPEVTNEIIQDSHITFEFQDDFSGVNYERIALYVNGGASNDVEIDVENKRVTVKKSIGEESHLEVPDKAGNILNIKINTYSFTTVH